MSCETYFDHVRALMDEAQKTDMEAIHAAAALVAETVMRGGIVQAFGCGHSRAAAMEIAMRAGGLVPVKLIDEPSQGRYEKVPGVGTAFMSQYDARPGDLFVIITNSGVNPMPVEVAQHARKLGCKVIALTAVEVCGSTPVKEGAKRITELADVVLDLHSRYGDAAIEVEGVPTRVCGTSSILSAYLLNGVMLEAIETMVQKGFQPPVLLSGNIAGGEEQGRKLIMQYYDRLLRNHTLYI
ncbi:MAG: SIS domain-containing protein [Clostridiaceae bacterium]